MWVTEGDAAVLLPGQPPGTVGRPPALVSRGAGPEKSSGLGLGSGGLGRALGGRAEPAPDRAIYSSGRCSCTGVCLLLLWRCKRETQVVRMGGGVSLPQISPGVTAAREGAAPAAPVPLCREGCPRCGSLSRMREGHASASLIDNCVFFFLTKGKKYKQNH